MLEHKQGDSRSILGCGGREVKGKNLCSHELKWEPKLGQWADVQKKQVSSQSRLPPHSPLNSPSCIHMQNDGSMVLPSNQSLPGQVGLMIGSQYVGTPFNTWAPPSITWAPPFHTQTPQIQQIIQPSPPSLFNIKNSSFDKQ